MLPGVIMADVAQVMIYLQIATVLSCLLVGSIMDFLKREVSDIPWIIMGAGGLITSILIIVFTDDRTQVGTAVGVNLAVGLVIGYLLYYTGVMGGADAKALMALSVNAVYPNFFDFTQTEIYRIMPFVFNTFFNWLLVMIVFYPLPLLGYNLYKKAKGEQLFAETNANFASKAMMLISGYLIPVEKAKNRHDIVYSEIYDEDEKKWEIKHFLQVQEVEEEEEFKKEVEESITETKRTNIWVKVLPPGIVFLLLGYIVNIFVGNVLFLIYHFAL
jgi:hypothetical protein